NISWFSPLSSSAALFFGHVLVRILLEEHDPERIHGDWLLFLFQGVPYDSFCLQIIFLCLRIFFPSMNNKQICCMLRIAYTAR
ncbi:hypothetical protein, partial [Brevibacillus sp. NRS-1366]|uniref:hypothetical protein n=1 Tax=Brevibacillus sp. NRS-1366 TaxID=3233899 RepID=UPI003D1AD725